MQLGRVRWANAELLARQAKDAMRRLKLTTLKLRLTRVKSTQSNRWAELGFSSDQAVSSSIFVGQKGREFD